MFGNYETTFTPVYLAFAKGSPVPGAIVNWVICQCSKLSTFCRNCQRTIGYAGGCVGGSGGCDPWCPPV